VPMKNYNKDLTKKLPEGASSLTLASAGYLLIMGLLTGLRPEHWALILIFNILFYIGKKTRKFVLGFAIFLIFAMLYDFMRAFPNYLYHPVDIVSVYNLEKHIFGIRVHNNILTPNEFFATNYCVAGDILSGLFYINWIPVPIGFAVYLFFTNRKLFLHFSLTFLLVNLLGFTIYYIHPAAPPWYVAQHGFVLNLHTPGSAAGLARFDRLIHLNVFGSIYTKNSNVFAAIPSLHCAYPVIVLYYSIKAGCGRANWLFGLFMIGIWFSAIYSGHHYTIDMILGVFCAIIGVFIYEMALKKLMFYDHFITRYSQLIIDEK
jgi:inositol phosphorylceramide synthase catalytic subunit